MERVLEKSKKKISFPHRHHRHQCYHDSGTPLPPHLETTFRNHHPDLKYVFKGIRTQGSYGIQISKPVSLSLSHTHTLSIYLSFSLSLLPRFSLKDIRCVVVCPTFD